MEHRILQLVENSLPSFPDKQTTLPRASSAFPHFLTCFPVHVVDKS